MNPDDTAQLYVGTSNIMLPVPNKQAFPEAFRNASRLSYYASLFNSLEVNSSFYKIPLPKTVERWTREVPADFRFTFKLNRDITHDKSSAPDVELVTRFMQTINMAQENAGSLLVQFPAGRTHNPAFLKRLLSIVEKENTAWDICVEFRHESWYRDDIYRLLESHDAAIVAHDKKGAPPSAFPGSDFAYLRYHGPNGDYKGTYEFGFLEQQATAVNALLQEGKTVYAYFNNTAGSAVFDALTLQELVTGEARYQP